MIIIKQNTSRLDSQIDRLQQQVVEKLHRTLGSQEHGQHQSLSWQITDIQTAALSLPKTSKDVLPPSRLADLISNVSRTLPKPHNEPHDISAAYQSDLVWLVTAKAAVRTLGLVLINLVEETHILSDEILYWDDILVSPWYIGFHVAQTTPFYIWDGAKNIFKEMNHDIQGQQSSSMTTRWTQFYDLIRQRVYMQPVSSVRTRISSHFALCKSEIRQKQKVLKAMKDLYASSVGLLMKDCLSFDFDENLPSTNGHQPVGSQWRDALTKNIILMEAILHNIADHSHVADFERSVSTTLRAEEHSVRSQFDERMMFENPSLLHERLVQILKELVPKHVAFSRAASQKYGHPPWIVRYWLPISFLLLSTSTSLRVLANKRAEILQWVMDIGSTAVDFWGNWVVEPIQRLVGTIRHDKDSEIAIMSKNSLEADRASLERMVVDFVQDRPLATHNEAVPIDAQTITASVKEGDLTPVLKAYERDLRSPFVGTVRGDLIRALLIQIQKTKVDVEVAISGIDSLLKSQELVFGFVGLTPGILVSYSVFQYVFSLFGSRRGLRKSKEQYQLRHALRNVDRTLATSSASANGILTYKGHGLLICESELLLEKAKYALHGADFRKFSEDIGDLIDVQLGVDRQLEVVRRIGWMYSQWF